MDMPDDLGERVREYYMRDSSGVRKGALYLSPAQPVVDFYSSRRMWTWAQSVCIMNWNRFNGNENDKK